MAKKPIKAIRCKHMPTQDNTVVIFSSKHGNVYQAGFTIGNQDFTVAERDTKEEAQWFCDVLETAFKTLINPKSFENFRDEKAFELAMNSLLPKITITNLKLSKGCVSTSSQIKI